MAGHGEGLDERLVGSGERGGQLVELVGVEHDPFCEPSGSRGAQEMEAPAVVGPTGEAVVAAPTAGEGPRRDRRTGLPAVVDTGTHVLDGAGDLMAHDGPGRADRRGDMEIAPADSAGAYPGYHLARAGNRVVDLRRLQPPVGSGEDDGAHVQAPMTTTGGSLMPCSEAHSFR